ncbi:MAG TPA: DEAD/DEAH box helicase [Steroidobacteraceae bacterium]|nr:DEAD/DEAH box helicase [Steroidobacteraceae bacterium]
MSHPFFHPAVAAWFEGTFRAPTGPQLAAWPAIHSGRNALIAAPTGSGKTLAAFMAAIDALVRKGVAGELTDTTHVVYVSPLKALSNDIRRNLEQPLAGITGELARLGAPPSEIRAQVRTGDTPQAERTAMRKRPPHILVTTPESLYLLLTSESGRSMLSTAKTVIVDEIHAVAATKRGAHLALSLERLGALCGHGLQRIGLSATQKPITEIANFLVGQPDAAQVANAPDCLIVDSGHVRDRDLDLELPAAPLEAVMSGEVWETVYDRLAQLVAAHRTTLIFANTRRMVERVTRHLGERLGEINVAAHHGSLAKEQRFDAESRLKEGKLKALVATASLELGIDIGDVELVCQLGSPRSISTFLQRVGRANHSVTGVPKGRIFPSSRDELIECVALLDAVRRGELDVLSISSHPLDVLAQQVVAELASRDYGEDELFALVRRAWPYRNLERAQFDAVVGMLSEGISTRRGRRAAYLHRDAVNRRLRARRGARLTAITCGGAIPDNADYQVILEPSGIFVGTLHEDFAVESLSGDIFQLGNSSYRILRVEAGRVRVEDAKGQPPSIPFWLGEAPARTAELSMAVSRLREQIDEQLSTIDGPAIERCVAAAMSNYRISHLAAHQIVEYLGGAKAVLGRLPTQQTLVFERFFDESGGMQLVIHAPFGARLNRAFGLALRKRFCRAFNFELQAAATEDTIVLSLGETHSFALEDVVRFLNSHTVESVLVQAVLDAPLFTTRWRWNASISLAVRRSRNGKRTPAPLQRMAAEDLISVVFPDQIACAENLTGEREIPDHPLVRQTLDDCLHEAMDVAGLIALLQAIEGGQVSVLTRDLPHPSPLAQEILTARPYAYLDDAPLEERRTQAVASRRWLDPQTASDFGKLDPQAIATVREEAWPGAENADELHDALMSLGLLTEEEGNRSGWGALIQELIAARRASRMAYDGRSFWIAAESLPMLRAIYATATLEPEMVAPEPFASRQWSRDEALVELVRGRLQALGPTTRDAIAASLAVPAASIEVALTALEGEGFVLRGQFTNTGAETEWCERRLLARIHRYTIRTLRAEIEPVSSADFVRFLLDWQGVTREPRAEGVEALAGVIEQLQGFEVPAAAWEDDVLAARLQDYDPNWLDSLCLSGRALWARLTPAKGTAAAPVRATPLSLLSRRNWALWQSLSDSSRSEVELSHAATALAEYLRTHGASFFDDMVAGSGLLRAQAETGLGELVAAGLVNSDSFSGLRALLLPADRKRRLATRRRRIALFGLEDAGRWSLIRKSAGTSESESEAVEQVAELLLRRYGVVFRRLLTREADWLPPWHALLRAYRRLEAQGHIRGGRFVAGVSGEQFALPDAVGALRAIRRKTPDAKLVSLSAADPLNLCGIVTPGPRVPALAGNRVLLRDGAPLAMLAGGQTDLLATLDPATEWAARNALLQKRIVSSTMRPS